MAGSMVGRTFNNRYTLTERVGLGGMAEVYRAKDEVLGRTVAVKVMLPQYAADPTFTKRFRQEAASAANLQSPYIVSIYDWGLDGETYYITMEFLRGTDLKTAIQERGAINQRKVAEIGSQVAQALTVAHEGGVIHRDIKPQNIMIQPDGNIKVMDFGIARAGDAGLSQTATVLGTAHYVSPEQAQGKELTGASDMYSLGVVMYEAVTGQLPFDGDDAVSVAVKQVNELPAPPSTINPNIDPNLEAIIMKALEKDPERRFKDASEMRHILNDFMAGRPINLDGDISGLTTQVIGTTNEADATAVMPATGNSTDATKVQNANKNYNANNTKKKSNKKKIAAVIIALIAIIAIVACVFAFSGDKVEVPDVTDVELEEAESTLEEAGFTVGTVTEVYSADIEEGHVVSTDPEAGAQATSGSAVNINVSKGTEEVTVPDLEGLTASEAEQALSAVGLVGEKGDSVYSDEVSEGEVAKQTPDAGSTANKGETVTYYLSKGEEKITIPNVVDTSLSNARTKLEDAGFSVSVTYDYSDSISEGNVISQSETGTATKGTTITLVVSNGPESTSVDIPNVVGMSQSEAQSAISNAGLRYDVQTQASDSVSAGIVISQNKTGTAEEGDTIQIVVSSGPASTDSSSTDSSSTDSSSTDSSQDTYDESEG